MTTIDAIYKILVNWLIDKIKAINYQYKNSKIDYLKLFCLFIQ